MVSLSWRSSWRASRRSRSTSSARACFGGSTGAPILICIGGCKGSGLRTHGARAASGAPGGPLSDFRPRCCRFSSQAASRLRGAASSEACEAGTAAASRRRMPSAKTASETPQTATKRPRRSDYLPVVQPVVAVQIPHTGSLHLPWRDERALPHGAEGCTSRNIWVRRRWVGSPKSPAHRRSRSVSPLK